MSSMMERLKKNGTLKESSVLTDSVMMNNIDETVTEIPAINLALSGSFTGGMRSGILTIAGPSRHFKSMYALMMASAYMKKYPEAVLMFYDSEFGSPIEYFQSAGIDPSRVLHMPIKNLEELKFDLVKQLDALKRGDRVFILIDSIGNLASVKEATDALDGKGTADMSRAKYLKGLYRIITPYLRMRDIPLVQIAHIYMSQDLFPKAIVSGGTGIVLSSDNVWLVSRSQDKDGTELQGFNFNINIEKSRYTRERTRIPITVKFDSGLSRYSGLLDIAIDLGFIVKPTQGWYSRVFDGGEIEAKKWRAKDTDTAAFWDPMLSNITFLAAVEQKYKISNGALLDDEIDEEMDEA